MGPQEAPPNPLIFNGFFRDYRANRHDSVDRAGIFGTACMPIAGGTDEIVKNNPGERAPGLATRAARLGLLSGRVLLPA